MSTIPWDDYAEPGWFRPRERDPHITVLRAVLALVVFEIGVRSDDRLCAFLDVTPRGAFTVSVCCRPQGDPDWDGPLGVGVIIMRNPDGRVECHVVCVNTSIPPVRVGDTRAARALGVDRRTWLAVRAIAELGMAHAAALTLDDLDAAIEFPQTFWGADIAAWLAQHKAPRLSPSEGNVALFPVQRARESRR